MDDLLDNLTPAAPRPQPVRAPEPAAAPVSPPPPPPPPPRPAAQATPTAPRQHLPLPTRRPAGSSNLRGVLIGGALALWAVLTVGLLVLVVAFSLSAPSPGPEPGPDPQPAPVPHSKLVKLGKEHTHGDIASARAAGWRKSAQVLREGKSVKEAEDAGEAEFNAGRFGTFEEKVGPTLKGIVPEGQEPADQAQREELARALEDLASGADGKAPHSPRGPPLLSKLFGWRDNQWERERLADTLPQRTLTLALPEAVGAPGAANVYLYRAWKEVLGDYPEYPAQQIGDCTSFGSAHAVDLLQCIDLVLAKSTKEGFRETSTEAIYGMGREVAHMLGSGDGCYGVAVSKALTEMGAVPRELVGPYSGQRAKQWGAKGVPAEIKSAAAEHKLGAATLVTTLDEADAALRNGYPFIVCSNQGFTMTRDADGVCQPQGTWAHCMFVAARRERDGKVQYCVCQSWGPKTPSGPLTDDQPPFSFWVNGPVIARMIGAQDSLAFSKFAGFVKRPVPARWTYAGFGDLPPVTQATPSDSKSLVARLTPQIRAVLEARKPEILANAGSLPRREAIKLAWPTLIAEVPTMLRAAIDLIVKELSDSPAPITATQITPAPRTTPTPKPVPAPERIPTARPEPRSTPAPPVQPDVSQPLRRAA